MTDLFGDSPARAIQKRWQADLPLRVAVVAWAGFGIASLRLMEDRPDRIWVFGWIGILIVLVALIADRLLKALPGSVAIRYRSEAQDAATMKLTTTPQGVAIGIGVGLYLGVVGLVLVLGQIEWVNQNTRLAFGVFMMCLLSVLLAVFRHRFRGLNFAILAFRAETAHFIDYRGREKKTLCLREMELTYVVTRARSKHRRECVYRFTAPEFSEPQHLTVSTEDAEKFEQAVAGVGLVIIGRVPGSPIPG